METFFIADAEVVSLSRKGLHVFGFCVIPWKDAPQPIFKCWDEVDVVQKFYHNTDLGGGRGALFFGIRELFSGCNTFLVDQNTRTSHKSLAQDLCRVVVYRCGVYSKFLWVRPKFGHSPVRRTPSHPKPPGFTRQPENSKMHIWLRTPPIPREDPQERKKE